MQQPQQPPRDIDSEKAVLGSIFLDDDKLIEVNEILSANDFYLKKHSIIFKAIIEVYDNEKPIDYVTVCNRLRQQGQLEDVGGSSYVSNISQAVPTAANARYYAKQVKEAADKRRAIKIGQKIKDLGYSEKNSMEIKEEANELLDKLETVDNDKVFKFGDTIQGYFDELEERYKSEDDIAGLPWPWSSVNRMTGGMKGGNLIVIAGRPSMGKTAVALSVAKKLSIKLGISTGIFSCEMSDFELKDRTFASEANVNGLKIVKGALSEEEWARLSTAAGKLSKAPLYLSDPSLSDLTEMKNEARKLKRKYGIKALMVDYLQLVSGVDANTRNNEVRQISRAFKNLALELDIPVVLLAQLSRAPEQRNNKRPVLSDLRASGSIEQDADLVAFLYRDEYYNPDTDKQGILEFIIGKQRNGPTGTIELVFLKQYQRVEEMSNRSG